MLRKLIVPVFCLSFALAGGCAGVWSGIKHAITGEVAATSVTDKPEYALGVVFGNIALTLASGLSGYFARHVQGEKKSP